MNSHPLIQECIVITRIKRHMKSKNEEEQQKEDGYNINYTQQLIAYVVPLHKIDNKQQQ